MSVAQVMTADEYLRRPETPPPRREELVAGEVVVTDPLPLHQYVVVRLVSTLDGWARTEPGRGRVTLNLDVRLDDRNVFSADVMWYAEGRAPARDGGRPSPTADIAVEVRSPSTWRRDTKIKKPTYERRGLPELWLVDTVAESVLVYRRSGPDVATFDVELTFRRGETLSSPLLPGFALRIDELFAH